MEIKIRKRWFQIESYSNVKYSLLGDAIISGLLELSFLKLIFLHKIETRGKHFFLLQVLEFICFKKSRYSFYSILVIISQFSERNSFFKTLHENKDENKERERIYYKLLLFYLKFPTRPPQIQSFFNLTVWYTTLHSLKKIIQIN